MIKFISFLAAFAVLLAVFSATINSASAQSGNFNVVVGSGQNHVLDTVFIPVSFTNVPDEGINHFEMTITYDPLKLRYEYQNKGKILPNGALLKVDKVHDGKLRIHFNDTSERSELISTDGVLTELRFDLNSIVGETPIVIDAAVFTDSNGNNVNATLSDGCVKGLPPYADFKIEIDSAEVNGGGQVVIPISFRNIPPNKISTCDLEVIYDPTKLEFVAHKLGKLIPCPVISFGINEETEGKIEILFLDYTMMDRITEEGLLVNLIFNVLSTGDDTTTIDLKAMVGDGHINPVITTIFPGTVTIKKPINKYTLKGYIKPDFSSTISAVNSGFKINSSFSAVTDENGYFEIKDVPAGTYYITISKANYLTREIEKFTVDSDEELSTPENPILLWAGDVVWAGDHLGIRRDGAINMWDISCLGTYFNSTKGDAKYSEDLDFNLDGTINFEDIFIVAKHFNKTSSDY